MSSLIPLLLIASLATNVVAIPLGNNDQSGSNSDQSSGSNSNPGSNSNQDSGKVTTTVVNSPTTSTAVVVKASSTSSSAPAATTSSQYATYLAQAQSGVSGLASGWYAAGCYDDDSSDLTLTDSYTWSLTMTYDTCTSHCQSSGYSYAGVESGYKCYCGNKINSGASISAYSNCNSVCLGNWLEKCGGSNYINVFSTSDVSVSTTSKAATTSVNVVTSSSATKAATTTSSSSTSSTKPVTTSTTIATSSTSTKAATTSTTVITSSTSTKAATTSTTAVTSSTSTKAATTSTTAITSSTSTKAAITSSSIVAATSSSATSTAPVSFTLTVSPIVNVTSIASSVAQVATSVVSSVIQNATSVLSSVVSSATQNATSTVSSVVQKASSIEATATQNLTSAATSTASNATEAVSSIASEATSAASSLIANATSIITSAAANATEAASSVVSDATSAVSSAAANATEAASSVVSDATSAVSSAAANATEAASSVVSDASSVVSSAAANATEAASSVVSSAAAVATSVIASLPTGWEVSTCIAEGTSGRALASASTTSSDMTQSMCAEYCADAGYTLAGIEYSTECYCADILTNGASLTLTSEACTMSCGGDDSAICGGSSALTLIVNSTAISSLSSDLTSKLVTLPTGWEEATTTCIAEGTSGRALADLSYATDDMTIDICLDYCEENGYEYAGTSYGRECYCGDSIGNGASLNLSSTACTMTCAGDDTEICGGSNALNLYVNPSLAVAVTTVVDSLPTGWEVSTCIAEGTSGRALASASTTSSDMTQSMCAEYCADAGYTLAGIEYSTECYCADVLTNGASLALTSDACTMSCGGDDSSICGGSSALTLIINSTVLSTLNSNLTAAVVSLADGWEVASTACIAEGTTGRALASASYASDDMTVDICLNYCYENGWQYAGISYSRECYCGDYITNGASLDLSSSACTMTCAGDSTEICGGSNALSLYDNPTLALVNTIVDGYAYQGCVQEVTGRMLSNSSLANDDMTIAICVDYCSDLGLPLAGLEYGRECYCGSTFSNGGSYTDLSTECTMSCAGDSTENCGGSDAIALYLSETTALTSLL